MQSTTRLPFAALRRPASRALRTLASEVSVSGVALHSGVVCNVRLKPAPANAGIHFVRIDSTASPQVIPARSANVTSTVLSTTIGTQDGMTIGTIEHLMAALCGLGVGACRVEVDAPELPVLDGSASPWVAAIRSVDLVAASAMAADSTTATAQYAAVLDSTVWVADGDSWVVAVPAQTPRLTVGIDFPGHAPIGRQWASWAPPMSDRLNHTQDIQQPEDLPAAADSASLTASFEAEVAPARTFALEEQLDLLRERGLIRGGSLDNALVCDKDGWLNPTPDGCVSPLRFANEPARHKLLDLLGDLALLGGGALPNAHITAFKAGAPAACRARESHRAAVCAEVSSNRTTGPLSGRAPCSEIQRMPSCRASSWSTVLRLPLRSTVTVRSHMCVEMPGPWTRRRASAELGPRRNIATGMTGPAVSWTMAGPVAPPSAASAPYLVLDHV